LPTPRLRPLAHATLPQTSYWLPSWRLTHAHRASRLWRLVSPVTVSTPWIQTLICPWHGLQALICPWLGRGVRVLSQLQAHYHPRSFGQACFQVASLFKPRRSTMASNCGQTWCSPRGMTARQAARQAATRNSQGGQGLPTPRLRPLAHATLPQTSYWLPSWRLTHAHRASSLDWRDDMRELIGSLLF